MNWATACANAFEELVQEYTMGNKINTLIGPDEEDLPIDEE